MSLTAQPDKSTVARKSLDALLNTLFPSGTERKIPKRLSEAYSESSVKLTNKNGFLPVEKVTISLFLEIISQEYF